MPWHNIYKQKNDFMKTIYLFLFIAFWVGMTSCQQIEEISVEKTEKAELSNDERGTLRFFYNGKEYVSEFNTVGEEVIFQDETVTNLVESLSQNKSLASYVHPNGTLEYFDSFDNLKDCISSEKSVETKAGLGTRFTESGVLTIFEDSKCKGESVKHTINSSTTHIEVANVGDHWNDRISSIDMVCNYGISSDTQYPRPSNHGDRCIVTFYEHEDFKGYSTSFEVDPYYPHSYIHYFKSIPLYPGSSKNWNDRATSLRFSFDIYTN